MVTPGVLERDIARNKIPMNPFARIADLVKKAISEWREDNASRLSASLAYYTTFSMAPLLVLVIAIAGIIGGREAAQNQVMVQVEGLLGAEGRDFIESMLISASTQQRSGILASIIGLVALIFGALGVFGELQSSLNTIWEVKPLPVKNVRQGIVRFLFQRLLSFAMVLSIGFVLMVSLAVSSALSVLGDAITNLDLFSDAIVQVINFAISFGVITLLFAIMFKYLPDAKIAWRDVWLGAGITSLLFNLGKFAIGLYLGRSTIGSTFGAAGSLALLLLWVYYSAQIFFLGAEFTQVYANEYGSKIVPDEDAVKVTEQERAQQGIPHQEIMDEVVEKQS
jgi:membrane protein